MSRNTCLDCGHDLPPTLPEGTCPYCLLKLAIAVKTHNSQGRTGSHLGATDTSHSNPPDKIPSDHIGRYKLLEPIGEGGFGTVWMAEQLEPVRRRVAVKILKLGMDTREVVTRFEAERQALALMDHPNIAKVFDAGTTDTGRPYFVMELVKGCLLYTSDAADE